MKKQLLPLAAVLTTLSGSVHAQTIFFQDFESGLSAKESVGGSFRINNTNAQKPKALPIIEETKFPLFVLIVVREQIAHEIAQRLHDHPVHRPERDRLAPCLPLWPRVADLPELRLVPVLESVKDPSPSAPEIVPGMPSGVRSARPAALSGWRKPARKTQSA